MISISYLLTTYNGFVPILTDSNQIFPLWLKYAILENGADQEKEEAREVKRSKQITTEPKRFTNVERFTLFATVIGLIVDLIALIGFVGLIVTPPKPSRASSGSDEFLIWMFIALLYSLGLINSLVYSRWRKRTRPSISENDLFRRIALAALTSLPVTYVYLRALEYAGLVRPDSSWWTFLIALLMVPMAIAPLIAFVGYGFEMVISAFER